jgi:VanZ like family
MIKSVFWSLRTLHEGKFKQPQGKKAKVDLRCRAQWQLLTSWSLSLLYMVVIFLLSMRSDIPLFLEFDGSDLVLHVAEYGILGLLFSWALSSSGVKKGVFLYVVAIGVLYGIADELHQYFVPGRNASLLDVIADGLGSMLGACLFRMLHSASQRFKPSQKHLRGA